MRRSQLSRKLGDVRKTLSRSQSNSLGIPQGTNVQVEANRILSTEERRYILIQGTDSIISSTMEETPDSQYITDTSDIQERPDGFNTGPLDTIITASEMDSHSPAAADKMDAATPGNVVKDVVSLTAGTMDSPTTHDIRDSTTTTGTMDSPTTHDIGDSTTTTGTMNSPTTHVIGDSTTTTGTMDSPTTHVIGDSPTTTGTMDPPTTHDIHVRDSTTTTGTMNSPTTHDIGDSPATGKVSSPKVVAPPPATEAAPPVHHDAIEDDTVHLSHDASHTDISDSNVLQHLPIEKSANNETILINESSSESEIEFEEVKIDEPLIINQATKTTRGEERMSHDDRIEEEREEERVKDGSVINEEEMVAAVEDAKGLMELPTEKMKVRITEELESINKETNKQERRTAGLTTSIIEEAKVQYINSIVLFIFKIFIRNYYDYLVCLIWKVPLKLKPNALPLSPSP